MTLGQLVDEVLVLKERAIGEYPEIVKQISEIDDVIKHLLDRISAIEEKVFGKTE